MPFPIALRHIAAGFLLAAATTFAASNPRIPPSATDVPLAKQPGKETAVFAGGCFWGVQSVFQRVKGVLSTTAGYSGGSAKTAIYKQVVTETTGHAESVQVVYGPSLIRQGPDVGTSYRSAIFYANEEQKPLAQSRQSVHPSVRSPEN